jgi:predicted acylesterase/phospholipase RssA
VKRALVLSGGGLFGAWQAGAWRALADRIQPDLVVGASVGSLNGYAIAGGASPAELAEFWREPRSANFSQLPHTIQALMERYSPRVEYAVVLTDLLRLKPRIFQGGEITWQHLAASCAIPGVLKQYKIGGRWYTDGGLLNPLPVWAAVELGATNIIALHALPQIPSIWMRPFVKGFRRVAEHNPPLPSGIELTLISTGSAIGSMTDALRWKHENIERWLEMGHTAASNISIPICSEP